MFTLDLALLLKAGARLDDALELLVQRYRRRRPAPDRSRKIRAAILSGESFGEALAHHPALFPPMYVALVRVGEASGSLDEILEVLAAERARAEALRRKLGDALRYPAFVLLAALARAAVLPAVRAAAICLRAARLQRQARSDRADVHRPLGIPARATATALAVVARGCSIAAVWLHAAPAEARAPRVIAGLSRLPLISPILTFHRTTLFCRNLGVLLASGGAADRRRCASWWT